MTMLLASAAVLLRLAGFFTEPWLDDEDIHAVVGESNRVLWTMAENRPLSVVTWNIERGIRFERVAETLDALDADIVLLQEVDRFCSRSDGRDVPRELAVRLRMNWVSGGEFQEIGEGRHGEPCVSGQAILSRLPLVDAHVLRFDDQASMKWRLNPAQPRRGGRVALGVRTGGVLVYSLHLESGSDEMLRGRQVGELVEGLDDGAAPVIIGGDFNNRGGQQSPMFEPLAAAGFRNTLSADESSRARRSIDWIFVRDSEGHARVVRVEDASDHDPVVARISGAASGRPRF
jgi:endonuclease/exonuclease/phosphatase family metal-dependent hydrolase